MFLGHSQVFFLRGKPQKHFPSKFYSISSDFTCSFLNDYFTKKVGKKFLRFQINFLKIVHKNVSDLSETLPAATRFNPEPIGFLIEVNFRKSSKIVTWLSKIEKIRKFWHLFVNLKNFIVLSFPNCVLNTLLFQRSGEWNFYSRKLSWFEQKFGLICQKTCFLSFDFEVFLRPIPKNCGYIFNNNAYWIPGLVITEFLNLFMQGSSLKVVQKSA